MPYLLKDIYELLINNNCKQMIFYLDFFYLFFYDYTLNV